MSARDGADRAGSFRAAQRGDLGTAGPAHVRECPPAGIAQERNGVPRLALLARERRRARAEDEELRAVPRGDREARAAYSR